MGIGAEAVARCELWRRPPFSEEAGALTRRFLTPAHRAALDCLANWMRQAGLAVRLDQAGTLIGRYEGTVPGKTVLIGSHIDSVRDAGAFDGALGVMLGLGCLEHLARSGRRFAFAIELLAFGDEEGSRFPASMIGSRALAGGLRGDEAACRDDAGVTLAEAMERFGLDVAALPLAARAAEEIVLYLEPHIEQGPVLEARDLPVGIVTGIAAQTRLAVTLEGIAAHAGTTPMDLRADALAAAAEAILAVERIAAESADVVGTVGAITASPGLGNVVAGSVVFSVDMRAPSAQALAGALTHLEDELAMICDRRGVRRTVVLVQSLAPCLCGRAAQMLLARAAEAQGVSPWHLASGAGHDAMSVSPLAPVAMLFIRCKGGISHNPAESVRVEDVDIAARVILNFLDLIS